MEYKSYPYYLFRPAFETPEIKEVEDAFYAKWLPMHSLPENAQLYHYTTLNGLQGILKNRCLWLGHISTLNDQSEIKYGQTILNGIIQESIKNESDRELRNFLGTLSNFSQAFNNSHHAFVGSFCKSGNLLSQWRAYANSGGGYCLGFEFSPKTQIATNVDNIDKDKKLVLRQIIYNEDEQRNLVKQYLDAIIKAAKAALGKQGTSADPSIPSVMAVQASNILLDMLLSFKNSVFESEEEWRMIYVTTEFYDPKTLQFREENGKLLPYRPMYIYDNGDAGKYIFPLRSIGFGPLHEPSSTHSAIGLLVQNIAVDDHRIIVVPHQVQIKSAGYNIRK